MTPGIDALKTMITQERVNGLVDIKFCIMDANSESTSVDEAAKVIKLAFDQYKAGETKEYQDY